MDNGVHVYKPDANTQGSLGEFKNIHQPELPIGGIFCSLSCWLQVETIFRNIIHTVLGREWHHNSCALA